MELTDEEILRYNRQIVVPGFNFKAQEKLKFSHVLVVGIGGLGCAALPYLVSSGIGHITLLDFDTVSLTNLHRQILHSQTDIRLPKIVSAAQKLTLINPDCKLELINGKLDDNKFAVLIARHHVILDCTDNIITREQINRLCFQNKIPLVSGAAIWMQGQLSVFTWKLGEPCYHCISRLFGEQHLSCTETGVIAPLVGVIGTMQAMETIKVLTEFGTPASSCMLIYDAMHAKFLTVKVMQDKNCEVCTN
ncbi:molybdopterin-synthase adenylyltransferase MoeB [Candidatus Pantoea carbekii]|uniref:Molybdopterin-synthase adenylyltransferase n=1 Tax=Candidatus Pantoea carbekii TaxID=1235990 RepID=U3U6U8_9GAMM|nr:molybdopterin-synthase adenylyltransferase MoeB [Candidatus Pantoea carbekii]AKC32173.1 molybdopterin biosynthesis protein MoeB [Candidatus Pantoea carbekii]BAO00700.1 MoeB protein [Candidatus Pantoea carbekii]